MAGSTECDEYMPDGVIERMFFVVLEEIRTYGIEYSFCE